MKKLVKALVLLALGSIVYGCSSAREFKTHRPPPDAFNTYYMQYTKLPGQKVCVLAVDGDGSWAFGYESGRATLEQATERAVKDCNEQRRLRKVMSKPHLFAVNDEIVYYKDLPMLGVNDNEIIYKQQK